MELNVQIQDNKNGEKSDLFPTTCAWNVIIDDKKNTLDQYIDSQNQKNVVYDQGIKKLKTVEWNAEENQPAFSSVRVNDDEIHSTETRDTLLFEFGDLIETEVEDKTVRINAKKQDTLASEERNGLLSKEMYKKLWCIEEEANKYIHPNSGVIAGSYHKVSVDERGHVIEGSTEPLSISEGGTGGRSLAEVKEALEIPEIEVLSELDPSSKMPVSSEWLAEKFKQVAGKEHGQHVPASDSFTSKRFLREGNYWDVLPLAEENEAGTVKLTSDLNCTDPYATLNVFTFRNQLEQLGHYIDMKISQLVGGADEAYDTLRELQMWVEQNVSFYEGLQRITVNKVDKIEGKGLSTNDLTDELLECLISAYQFTKVYRDELLSAERNTIVSIYKNGQPLEPNEDRVVDIPVPTKVSELENDSKYLTKHPKITVDQGTSSSKSMNPGESVNLIASVIRDEFGHITGFDTKTVTFPSATKNPEKISIQVDGASQTAYDGSIAEVVNLLAGTNMKVEITEEGIKFTPNYPEATDSTSGLMGAAEHKKLTGIAEKANNYSLPTAGRNKLGGVQTSSTVTDVTNYTPTPIVNGIPYYQKSVVDVLTAAPTNPPVGYMWVVK